jgi:hypothetical protein
MRNRAKCKLCSSILESFHATDLVVCKCGEISISGGNVNLECSAKNWENFLRIDENDHEIVVKVVDKDQKVTPPQQESGPITREDCIEMLEAMLKNIHNLPPHGLASPISHFDLYSYLTVVLAIFKRSEK